MKTRSLAATEFALLVCPLFLIGCGGVVRRIHQDTFSQDLQALAGPGAIYCANSDCALQAFQQNRPFWTRTERHIENLLSCNTSGPYDISEARVYTTDHTYYELTRTPPSGLRPARITKRRWINPHLDTGPSGEQSLWREATVEVEPQ